LSIGLEQEQDRDQATHHRSIIFANDAKKIPLCFVGRDEALKLIEPERGIIFICIKERFKISARSSCKYNV